jgi:hypothetical protein
MKVTGILLVAGLVAGLGGCQREAAPEPAAAVETPAAPEAAPAVGDTAPADATAPDAAATAPVTPGEGPPASDALIPDNE